MFNRHSAFMRVVQFFFGLLVSDVGHISFSHGEFSDRGGQAAGCAHFMRNGQYQRLFFWVDNTNPFHFSPHVGVDQVSRALYSIGIQAELITVFIDGKGVSWTPNIPVGGY